MPSGLAVKAAVRVERTGTSGGPGWGGALKAAGFPSERWTW